MDETLQQQVNEIERKLNEFLSEYYRNNNPSTHIFTKAVSFKNTLDLSSPSVNIGSPSGTVGLYGSGGVVKAAAITAPSTPSAGYVQAEAQSAVDKINLIRTALNNIGITA